MLTVQITIKNVFGINKAYPVNTSGELFARIAQTKTLTRKTLGNILALGATIQEVDRFGRAMRSYVGPQSSSNLPATIE